MHGARRDRDHRHHRDTRQPAGPALCRRDRAGQRRHPRARAGLAAARRRSRRPQASVRSPAAGLAGRGVAPDVDGTRDGLGRDLARQAVRLSRGCSAADPVRCSSRPPASPMTCWSWEAGRRGPSATRSAPGCSRYCLGPTRACPVVAVPPADLDHAAGRGGCAAGPSARPRPARTAPSPPPVNRGASGTERAGAGAERPAGPPPGTPCRSAAGTPCRVRPGGSPSEEPRPAWTTSPMAWPWRRRDGSAGSSSGRTGGSRP